jgi:erythronate-4-phosphate dehydrogenase
MVLEAMCGHFGLKREWNPAPLMPPPAVPRVRIQAGLTAQQALRQATRAAYDIEADDGRLREMLGRPAEERGRFFSTLRKKYAVRREFPALPVERAAPDAAAEAALRSLDFCVAVGSNI